MTLVLAIVLPQLLGVLGTWGMVDAITEKTGFPKLILVGVVLCLMVLAVLVSRNGVLALIERIPGRRSREG